MAAVAIVGAIAFAVAGEDKAAVLGSGELDLSTATSSTSVDAGVLFGSAKAAVPDAAAVDLRGVTVFGSSQCQGACTPADPGAVTSTVHGTGGSAASRSYSGAFDPPTRATGPAGSGGLLVDGLVVRAGRRLRGLLTALLG